MQQFPSRINIGISRSISDSDQTSKYSYAACECMIYVDEEQTFLEIHCQW